MLQLLADLFIPDVAVQAVVADALKALGQNVLDHSTDEAEHGKRLMLDRLGLVILVPVADRWPVVLLDASHIDGRRGGIPRTVTPTTIPVRSW